LAGAKVGTSAGATHCHPHNQIPLSFHLNIYNPHNQILQSECMSTAQYQFLLSFHLNKLAHIIGADLRFSQLRRTEAPPQFKADARPGNAFQIFFEFGRTEAPPQFSTKTPELAMPRA
jgi:hypothetical protein